MAHNENVMSEVTPVLDTCSYFSRKGCLKSYAIANSYLFFKKNGLLGKRKNLTEIWSIF